MNKLVTIYNYKVRIFGIPTLLSQCLDRDVWAGNIRFFGSNAEEKYGSRRKLLLLCRNSSIADFASGNLGWPGGAATYPEQNDGRQVMDPQM